VSDRLAVEVTVVIAARNEAANIVECIESVRWAREILVVENDSTDDTVDLARRAGATVISQAFSTIGGQRNAAFERAASDWILVVDADERGTEELGAEIQRTITEPRHEAYRIRRRSFFLGREIRHGGWEAARPIRLVRRALRYNSARVHEHIDAEGPVGELAESLLHYTYTTLSQYFEKLGRYSQWWAEDRFERGRRAGIMTLLLRPPARFFSMYVIRGGWMDGAPGVVVALLGSVSVLAKYAALWALGDKPDKGR
jgi:glycosyltransferase involved in cell wall biosynthesis